MLKEYSLETKVNWGGEKYTIKLNGSSLISFSEKETAVFIIKSLSNKEYLDIVSSEVSLRKMFRARFNTLLVKHGLSKPLSKEFLELSVFSAGEFTFNFKELFILNKDMKINLTDHETLDDLFSYITNYKQENTPCH